MTELAPHAATDREFVPCPLCRCDKFVPWAEENGFSCVRCSSCGLLYVNPRPSADRIDRGVRLGVHALETSSLSVVGSRHAWQVPVLRRAVTSAFPEFAEAPAPIRWLDVGAGFGELLEALAKVMPPGSAAEGIEPMVPKAESCRRRGLLVRTCYLSDVKDRFDVVSIMDVFSHVPEFSEFLAEIKKVLHPEGEVFIKTGNGADIGPRSLLPDPLTLPDHLVFAGSEHLRRFLEDAGFEIVHVASHRMDGLVHSARNLAKWVLGRPVCLRLPYSSPARVLYIRARLRRS